MTVVEGYVRKLVAFGALYDTIENQYVTVCLGLEDEDVLIERFFDVEDFVDLECHGLARPLGRDFPEPTICETSDFAGFMTDSSYRE
jgi:hypothetical protein